MIKKWLGLVDQFFSSSNNSTVLGNLTNSEIDSKSSDVKGIRKSTLTDSSHKGEEKRIGVHCVAGLGRAPFLVAIALVNNGCSPQNAIELIRKNRPGALNWTQANYILEFKGNSKKNKKTGQASCQCTIF